MWRGRAAGLVRPPSLSPNGSSFSGCILFEKGLAARFAGCGLPAPAMFVGEEPRVLENAPTVLGGALRGGQDGRFYHGLTETDGMGFESCRSQWEHGEHLKLSPMDH
ncbi:hypothetical protein GCM10027259_06900 [Micromonospora palomenae]